MFEPRFHAGIYTWHFRPHINPVWTSYKVATKTFHVIQGPLNTFRLVACFLHEIPTGLCFMTFAAGLRCRQPKAISTLDICFWGYTAISRKDVGQSVHATIPKGNMGCDQYTAYFCCFLLAHANIVPCPLVSFFQASLNNYEFKTTQNTFRDCRVHFSDNLSRNSCRYAWNWLINYDDDTTISFDNNEYRNSLWASSPFNASVKSDCAQTPGPILGH